jgi:DNA ligase (NAD+)
MQDAWPYCPNYYCTDRVYGRIQKFVNVLDLKGSGIETVYALVKAELVKQPADLFDVKEEDFVALEGKGEKHYAKFQQGLQKIRSLRTPQIFAAMDFEGVGTFEAICSIAGLQNPEEIIKAAEENPILFAKAERVSEEKAERISKEIIERKQELLNLLSKINVKKSGSKLLGKSFCLTGSLSRPRPIIEDEIRVLGGSVSGSVSKRTNYLVCEDPDSNSGKAKKARELGVILITEESLIEMMK